MIFERFVIPSLGHYSYLVACPHTLEAFCIDPARDVDVYINVLNNKNLKLRYVLETHVHADYASGARELAARSGANLCLSAYDENELYEVGFPHHPLCHGDVLLEGNLQLKVLHTPGHTPEHISFLLEQREKEIPSKLFSGDFLFIHSLGRPDLLGVEAKHFLAKQLYHSVCNVLSHLEDSVEVWPSHGAGSFCGAKMSSTKISSTLGEERCSNPYLNPNLNEKEFIDLITSHRLPTPSYFLRMKDLNAKGPALLNRLPGDLSLSLEAFEEKRKQGALVLDVRGVNHFALGHVPNSLFIGLGGTFSTWAGWLLSAERAIILITDSPRQRQEAIRGLIRVGLDLIEGDLQGGVQTYLESSLPLDTMMQIQVDQLQEEIQSNALMEILDVRSEKEVQKEPVEGALHIPLGQLQDKVSSLSKDKHWAILCEGGYRSMIACSILKQKSFGNVFNISRGMALWRSLYFPSQIS